MSVFDRTSTVHENVLTFLDSCSGTDDETDVRSPEFSDADLTPDELIQLMKSQLASRQSDLVAREMRKDGTGYYTIPSAGHEANAGLAQALRTSDPCMVHYRSAAFMIHRLYRSTGSRPLRDLMRSFAASSEDPVAAGRHKVFGDADTMVPPQTSTIASHLPRAAGMAFGIDHAKRMDVDLSVPSDAIMSCSFGDASVNHSVFQGALNAVLWATHQDLSIPLLLVCEDNGLGISVPTPDGWIEASMTGRPGLTYMSCDGCDVVDTYQTACSAIEHVRSEREPVFLHLHTVRLLGHSGADIEQEYRDQDDITSDETRDPIIQTARTLIENDMLTPERIKELYNDFGKQMRAFGQEAASEPKLSSAEEVMRPLDLSSPPAVRQEATRVPDHARDTNRLPHDQDPLESTGKTYTFARLLNRGLTEMMVKYDHMLLFGEDMGRKGGVYNITGQLQDTFGSDRVFDTLLDETSILGLALGLGTLDYLPVPEIQYLAYVYNAYDQLRGESTSLSFFSDGQLSNGMVVRVPSFAYQEGIGGHFHNDNGIAALREIPGIMMVVPSRGDDAVKLLRTAMAHAYKQGHVVLFLEPIALYHRKHLHQNGDEELMHPYPDPGTAAPIGSTRTYNDEAESGVTILTYGNGVRLSRQAAHRHEQNENERIRIVDLRWLKPINRSLLADEAERNRHILVVDECRRHGGPGEELVNALTDTEARVNVELLSAADSFVPLGPAADEVLVTVDDITSALQTLVNG
jgi:2-oxoisovalerate dehydrogenase E1 component